MSFFGSDDGEGMFTLPPNPTEEQITRARLRTLRTVWAVVLALGVVVVIEGVAVGLLHVSNQSLRTDVSAAREDTEKATSQAQENNDDLAAATRNGFKTRALLCTDLIYAGADVTSGQIGEICTEDGIEEFFDRAATEAIRAQQLGEICQVVADLGAPPPSFCEGVL